MTWTSPATPTPGTAITVSFWNTNARDNLNHLRAMLPDATNGAILQGTGSATAAWTSSPTIASLATSGALTVGTTLGVTGATTFTGATTHNGGLAATSGTFSTTLGVTGVATFNASSPGIDVVDRIYVSGNGIRHRSNPNGVYIWFSATDAIDFVTNSTRRGFVKGDGQLFWDGEISAATLTDRSDDRLKTDVVPASDAVTANMRQLQPIRYREPDHGTHPNFLFRGFSAQSLQRLFPEAVLEHDEPVRLSVANGVEELELTDEFANLLSVSPYALAVLAIQYAQELDQRIQALEAA